MGIFKRLPLMFKVNRWFLNIECRVNWYGCGGYALLERLRKPLLSVNFVGS